jgi:glycosyltransferase involved in cell wall biosynthesis
MGAAKKVVEQDGKAYFVLAGDGPQMGSIRSLADGLGIGEHVELPGKVGRKELIPLIQKSSVVVIPSIKEGMPFSLLEAMSSGKAVVASDIPGINDIIVNGENGMLVPPGEPAALARAMVVLRRDPALRERLGRNARNAILKNYCERVVVDRIEGMYREARGYKP